MAKGFIKWLLVCGVMVQMQACQKESTFNEQVILPENSHLKVFPDTNTIGNYKCFGYLADNDFRLFKLDYFTKGFQVLQIDDRFQTIGQQTYAVTNESWNSTLRWNLLDYSNNEWLVWSSSRPSLLRLQKHQNLAKEIEIPYSANSSFFSWCFIRSCE